MATRKGKKKFESLVEPEHEELIDEISDFISWVEDTESDQREAIKDDLAFLIPGNHWPKDIKAEREADGRPCLEVDRLTPFINQVVNEQRQNRPQPSVNPTGDGATRETAEILQGMIRHIAYMSDGDVAIDTAFEQMIRAGKGYFRVLTEYSSPDAFEQDIIIRRIEDPLSVFFDPTCNCPDGSDADRAAIVTYLPTDQFKAEYPNSKISELTQAEWESIYDVKPDWASGDGSSVRVVEYYKRIRKPFTLCELSDGSKVDKKDLPEGVEPVRERQSFRHAVKWYKVCGTEILDETDWPGKYIPIFPVLGNELIVDGQKIYSGLVRTAKDPMRFFDFWKSAQAEMIALAPKAPWVAEKGSLVNEAAWKAANRRPVAVLEFEGRNDRGEQINMPTRSSVEPPIMAINAAMMGAVDDLKASTGMYDPSLGQKESSQSGVAIRQLQRQGQVGNYHYQDNLSRTIRHLGRVLVDLAPKIYDTQRVIRIVRPDESSDLVTINGPQQQPGPSGVDQIYDLSVGTYDVTISVGPGYQTKRQENLALLESMLQGPLGQAIATAMPDLVMSLLDFSISKEMQERMQALLPPPIQALVKKDGKQQQNPIPPEFKQQMDQLMQQHEQLVAALHQAKDQLEDKNGELAMKERLELYKQRTEILKALIQLSADEARVGLEQELAAVEAAIDSTMQDEMQQPPQMQETPQSMYQPMQQPEMDAPPETAPVEPSAQPQPGVSNGLMPE